MARRTGYLSCVENIPPLVFRFQFNPEILSDKKSLNYDKGQFGQWRLDNFQSMGGSLLSLSGLKGLKNDAKEIGALLMNTKPLESKEGEPRQITLEFKLDASVPGPLDGDSHYDGSILPDIQTLRSFMAPSIDVFDLLDILATRNAPCWKTPPTCSVSYGHVSMTGVMTDLDIRVVDFFEDGNPKRAEVTATVKEQTYSMSPIIDTITRTVYVAKSYTRKGFLQDVVDAELPSFITDSLIKR